MSISIDKMRNIGISAHIDSGKTTLTERILFYCGRIHAIHEVKGKDGVGATMDSMELERERGITIQSAATSVQWGDKFINIIDTPGHVDFTIEVERSLRVLDGAILVLCSVAGVQSQSITVDRQMKRYDVPRLAFINKADRTGANPYRVREQLRDKLGHNAVFVTLPIGLEEKFEGVIDLVKMVGVYFEGEDGLDMVEREIPAGQREEAAKYREMMLEELAMFNDELMELHLEGKDVPVDLVKAAIRKGTISRELTAVFVGSAYKNKGVQVLLNGVSDYLPAPTEKANWALDQSKNEEKVALEVVDDKPTVALAFKLDDGQYGQLTYVRIYQGVVKKGMELKNMRTQKRFKIGRLIKMHSNHMEDIDFAGAGDIAALFGIECASGDTFCDDKLDYTMTSMFVPAAVISLSIEPIDKKSGDNMAKALNRFTKEDPTFRTFVDPESNQTIVQGMGELHLEVYIERMKREYKAEVKTGMPQVAYREAISEKVEFTYVHKKQTGGSGQYAKIGGFIEPFSEKDYNFVNMVKGGSIPNEFIPSCDKGFREAVKKGTLIGFPVVGVQATVNDGASHPVDSSDMAFSTAALMAFRENYAKAKPIILEPIMRVAVEGPTEFQGNIFGSINQRRGVIIGSTEDGQFCAVQAEVPLSEMFGYSTVLRSMSQGKAEFTMEFEKYAKVPESVSATLKKEYEEKRKAAQK
jgi:elongation factor G